jgi:uncharacterized protein YdhG (YjbR/CyaY superfamily)
MAKTDFRSVDDYIASKPEDIRPTLERVRDIIRKALPIADEGISYQIPTYKVDGAVVVYFAGWKEHFSLYPIGDRAVEALGPDLARFKMSKGTVQFPLSKPIPAKLIERLVKFRATETADLVAARAARLDARKSVVKKRAKTKPA